MELKPCPFCGGEAKYVEILNGDYSAGWVECAKRGIKCCTQQVIQSKAEAIEAWNRRADND